MNTPRRLARWLGSPRQRTAAVWLSVVMLSALQAYAECPSAAAQDSSSCWPGMRDSSHAGVQVTEMIGDVALQPGGVMNGRIVSAADDSRTDAVAGLRVLLLRQNQVVAETATDYQGRFAMRNLSGGFYHVLVDTTEGTRRSPYRVWSLPASPPGALRAVNIPISGRMVRGQSPFRITDVPRAAALTAIAAGAIAAPIIYHNAKVEPQIPASF